ncbi:hypothetical protein DPM19_21270 [Actinomadura craniellae]|uniref:Serine aminopeptidase S33 domain-containing protein n=1 Tax=Actinomadura craniellae TaxID=2231787 RepID=A0A365H1W9_9ACTN|nr:alpha/beta fold hydrolase [Actinomadura craniellae]RAY13038.1 hypothetical protein DPM19_21270 [Actinomadura craniellae]
MSTFSEKPITMRTADDVTLAGTLVVTGKSSASAVVMLHGINADRHEHLGLYDHLAERLAGRGTASLRFDFRAHGESAYPQEEMTIAGLCLDVKAAIRTMIDRLPDLSRLTLLGTSFGAAPAAYTAGTEPLVKNVLLFAPVLDYVLTFLRPTTEWAKASFTPQTLAAVPETGHLLLDGERRLGAKLLTEMEILHPADAVRAARVPTVVIHGDSDSMVPAVQSRGAAGANPLVDVRIVPGMDHGYMDVSDPDGVSARSLENRTMIGDSLVSLALGKDGHD